MQPSIDTAGRTIVNTRILRHPPERVWQAFSEPARLAQWWGPEGFTNTIKTFDLRPGGMWNLVMHGPNGADFDNTSVFEEVVPGRRVVYKHLGPVHVFRMAIDLKPEVAGTRMTWTMTFESAAEFDQVKAFVAAANEQNLNRLEAHLAS